MKIYISGSMAYDEIMNFPHYFKDYFHPERLHQINVSFAVQTLAKHLGGCATNIAFSLRKTVDYLVNPNSKFNKTFIISPVGSVGKDGKELLDFFKKNNIDIANVQKDEKLYTATGKVITDKKDNQIWGFYYGASKLGSGLKALTKDQSSFGRQSSKKEDFWILTATHERPFTSILQYVIRNKLHYLFDPGMTLTWISDDLLKQGVMNAAYVVGNDYEVAMIEKRLKMTVKEMVKMGVNVITTLGEKGVRFNAAIDSVADLLPASALSQRENPRVSGRPLAPRHLSHMQSIAVKAIKLRKVVDPTGAGDAWRGGFVGALVSGKTLRECLVMGNVMASFAVENVGTVEYKADNNEIKKRVASITKK